MKKKIFLAILCFFFRIDNIFCQTIEIYGFVTDSLHNPLPNTNIIAKPKDISKNLQFAITDNEGYYKLTLIKGDTLTISISYLGYKPIDYLFVAQLNTKKDFVLQQSSQQLEEVVIEMPVTIRGDTTIYNTSKFIDGSERKLKDVLKKLPGVEVSKDGRIIVQGKKVTKMLVDGKKFFGGNSKLAVENIPANAVDNVEVIDNYNDVAFLKGLSDSEEMAMDIKLKEDKKRFVFGDVEVGKGNQDFYETSANLFYYSPETKINFIGNLNNLGKKTFTFEDYLSFSGGVNAVFNGNFNWKGGDFSQFIESRDALESKQEIAALNITKTTSDNFDISGYGIFSNSKTVNKIKTLNEYTTFTEDRISETETDNLLGIGNISIEYNPNSQEKWTAKTQLKRTNNNNENLLSSLVNNNTNIIETNRNLIATNINQNIEWHKRKNEKHTFSAIINYIFSQNEKTTFWETTDQILQGLIPVKNNQTKLLINQLKETEEHNFDAIFKHFWELNSNNHIYTTIGNKFLQEKFISDDYQILDNNSINNFSNANFGNNINFKLNNLFVGIHYKFRTGILTTKYGFNIHNYNWHINQLLQNTVNKWVILPDFLAKIEFNKSKKITINYSLKNSFSDANKFANRFYLNSYNSIFKGNENLQNNLFHTARIYYNRFSLYRGLLLFGSLSYNKQIRGVRNTVDFDDVNQFLTVKMFDNPSESARGNIHLEKTIKSLKYKFHLGFDSSNYIQELNNNIQNNKNNNQDYEFAIETLFDKFPTIEIGIKQNIGRFTTIVNTTKFNTTEPFAAIDYSFLNGFIFNFDYQKSIYQNKTLNQKNVYEIANTTLSYQKENSSWSYKLTAQNIFNASFRQSNSFNDFLISDTKIFILPRIIMFSIGYNL